MRVRSRGTWTRATAGVEELRDWVWVGEGPVTDKTVEFETPLASRATRGPRVALEASGVSLWDLYKTGDKFVSKPVSASSSV